MPSLDESYPLMAAELADRYGRPGRAREESDLFARIVLAILGQTLAPKQAAIVLEGMRESGLLTPAGIVDLDPQELAECIRPARVSVPGTLLRVLKRLANWILEAYAGQAERLETVPTAQLREELLAIRSVGTATADALLLRAFQRAEYPVDRASYRILVRHGWIDPGADYDEARETIKRLDSDNPSALAAITFWLERVGQEYCRPMVAKCDRCPLRPFLPEGGPREPE